MAITTSNPEPGLAIRWQGFEPLGPEPVIRRGDIRLRRIPPDEVFRDVTDGSGCISLPIIDRTGGGGTGASNQTCFDQWKSYAPYPIRDVAKNFIRRTPPEGGYPPSGLWVPGTVNWL